MSKLPTHLAGAVNDVVIQQRNTPTTFLLKQVAGVPGTVLGFDDAGQLAGVEAGGGGIDVAQNQFPARLATGTGPPDTGVTVGPDFSLAGNTLALASVPGDVTAAAPFGTDNAVVRSDGTGKGVQASGVTIDDAGNLRVPADSYDATAWNGNLSVPTKDAIRDKIESLPPPGTGDVTAASTFGTDNRVIRSDGTGRGVQVSGVSIDDSGNLSVPADAYDATLWNGNLTVPTKDAVRDKIEVLVVGPAGATNNGVVRFDSPSGKLVKDSVVGIDDSGNVFTAGSVTVGDQAYDASAWDGNVTVPTKNALRDKIVALEALIGGGGATLGANTFTGKQVVSVAGAADTPAISTTGSWFSGGTATTTKPKLLVEAAGAATAGWSTSGTGLGVNAATGFAGRLLDLQVNGVTVFNVNNAGALIANSFRSANPAGGTAGIWKLGTLVTTAVTFDTTRYIQLDVGGTLYKLALAV